MEEARKTDGDSAYEMVSLIREIREYAEKRNPRFIIIQQNAAALCEENTEIFSIVDAIAQEAVWYDGIATDKWNDRHGYDTPNEPSLTNYYIEYLDRYKAAGVPVFNCEYARDCASSAYKKSLKKGYIPYCTRRSLSKLTTTPPPEY